MTTFVLSTGSTASGGLFGAAPAVPLLRPRFTTFLRDRLEEELVAARRRVANGTGNERGVAMVRDILRGLRAHRAPAVSVIQMLLVAYAKHPAFEPEWASFPCVALSVVDDVDSRGLADSDVSGMARFGGVRGVR